MTPTLKHLRWFFKSPIVSFKQASVLAVNLIKSGNRSQRGYRTRFFILLDIVLVCFKHHQFAISTILSLWLNARVLMFHCRHLKACRESMWQILQLFFYYKFLRKSMTDWHWQLRTPIILSWSYKKSVDDKIQTLYTPMLSHCDPNTLFGLCLTFWHFHCLDNSTAKNIFFRFASKDFKRLAAASSLFVVDRYITHTSSRSECTYPASVAIV